MNKFSGKLHGAASMITTTPCKTESRTVITHTKHGVVKTVVTKERK